MLRLLVVRFYRRHFLILSGNLGVFGELALEVFVPLSELVTVLRQNLRSLQFNFGILLNVEVTVAVRKLFTVFAEFERYLYVFFRRFRIRSRLNVFKFLVLSCYRCVFSELALQVFASAGELPAVSRLNLWSVIIQINFLVLLDIDYRLTFKCSVLALCKRYSRILFGRFRSIKIGRAHV